MNTKNNPQSFSGAGLPAQEILLLGKLVLRFSCLLSLAYLAVYAGMDRADLSYCTPTYEDDYRTLAYNFPFLPLVPVRPLAFFLSLLMGSAGAQFCFVGAQVLTLLNIALFFTFTSYYLQLRKILLVPALCAVCCALSLEHLVDFGRYLAVLFSLYAGIFAALSFLCLTYSFRTSASKSARAACAVGVLFALLSLLCKEEFCVPLIVFCLLCTLPKMAEPNRGMARTAAVSIALISFVVLAFEKFALNSPFLGTDSSYTMQFSIFSVLNIYWKYLTNSTGTIIACVAQFLALLFALCFSSKRTFVRLCVLLILTLVIISPFTLLPNHFVTFYTFDWTVLQSATLLILCNLEEVKAVKFAGLSIGKETILSLQILMVIAISLMMASTDKLRLAKFAWYNQRASFNNKILVWLKQHRAQLNSHARIAVLGLPLGSPWYANDGAYLSNKLGLTPNWLVLTPSNGNLFRAQKAYARLQYGSIEVKAWDAKQYSRELAQIMVLPDGSIAFTDLLGHRMLLSNKPQYSQALAMLLY